MINIHVLDRGGERVQRVTTQRAVHEALPRAGITKRASCHTFRHSFATHPLEDSYDIRTLQELLDHRDVRTTMVYAHDLDRGGAGGAVPDRPVVTRRRSGAASGGRSAFSPLGVVARRWKGGANDRAVTGGRGGISRGNASARGRGRGCDDVLLIGWQDNRR